MCRPQDIQLCGSRSGPVNQTILHYSPGTEFYFALQINLKYNLISGEFSILQGLFARESLSQQIILIISFRELRLVTNERIQE
jgi:hypothetical protein